MTNHEQSVTIDRLAEYRHEDAIDLGRLMPQLDPSFTGEPTSQQHLEFLIASPHHEQLVARLDQIIVGAATMNVIAGAGRGRFGQLEDFVVDEVARGRGVADKLWDEMLSWCRDKGLGGFELETEEDRVAAINFYRRKGARLIEGTTTHYTVSAADPTQESVRA